jgi:hypothetical protein
MFKVYRLDGVSGIIAILLLLTLLVVLAMILSPILIGIILLVLIYLGYRKFKKSIKEFVRNIKKKKIKIKNESQNGEVKIHFAKSVSIDAGGKEKEQEKQEGAKLTIAINDNAKGNVGDNTDNDNAQPTIKNAEKVIPDDLETKQFITYLIEKGFKFKDDLLYYNDKLVYPIYKKSYPINEIIRLYDDKPKTDIIVLGLKGEPYKPKFIYLIPVENSKERMSIDELRNYLTNI